MALVIGLLASIEFAVLRSMGYQYQSAAAIRAIRVCSFAVSFEGRWAISRIQVDRAGLEKSVEWSIVLHDLQRVDRPYHLGVGRSDLRSVAISPAGDQVAFSSLDGAVNLWSRAAGGGSPRMIHRLPDAFVSGLIWSPDGRYLAGYDRTFLYLWAAPSGALLHALRHGNDPDHASFTLSFSKDSRTLLSAGDDGRLRLWDVPKGRLIKALAAPGRVASAVLFSDSKRVAFLLGDELLVWSFDEGGEVWRRPPLQWRKNSVALTVDDRLLATVEREAHGATKFVDRVMIHCASTGRLESEIHGVAAPILGLAFTPDGTLCSWDLNGEIIGWDLQSRREAWRISCLDAVAK